jgi:hypothetical protein
MPPNPADRLRRLADHWIAQSARYDRGAYTTRLLVRPGLLILEGLPSAYAASPTGLTGMTRPLLTRF